MPTWQQLKKDKSLWEVFFLRQKIVSIIRNFFEKKGFLEVFTPLLQPSVIPESYHDLFSTTLIDQNNTKKTVFLTPSPEISIKKMLAGNSPNIFEITKSFRNRESGSNFHNHEFTILEWYRKQTNYMDLLEDCQNLILEIAKKIINRNKFTYQNYNIDLTLPWGKISVAEALEKYADISFDEITNKNNKKEMFPISKIVKVSEKKGYKINSSNTWEEIFNQIYLNEIEPNLGTQRAPTIIYDYPAPLSALAKLKKSDNRIAERFEIYIGRIEIADGCTELTDFNEQKKRFEISESEIKNSTKNKILPDTDFLEALKQGLPSCAGIALGIDRLVMLFGNKKYIRDTLLTSD